jgi:vacuolar-type H+-ATPase subunit D/Vma8
VRKATKIVNALQKFILPQLEERIHTIVASIEEEERDEAVRRKMRAAGHRSPGHRSSSAAAPETRDP